MKGLDLVEDVRPLSAFRADAAGMIERVRKGKRTLVLTQRGHTAAVVLGVDEYQRLVDELELLRDVHAALGQLERGEAVPHAEAKRRAPPKRR